MTTNEEIIGTTVDLPDHRSVFVGRSNDGSDHYYIQFKNGTARQRFKISAEAANILAELLRGEDCGGRETRFPVEKDMVQWRWQVVKDTDA